MHVSRTNLTLKELPYKTLELKLNILFNNFPSIEPNVQCLDIGYAIYFMNQTGF